MASRGLLNGRAARRVGRLALGPALVVIALGLVGVNLSAGQLYGGGLTVFSLAVAAVLANLVMWPGPLNLVPRRSIVGALRRAPVPGSLRAAGPGPGPQGACARRAAARGRLACSCSACAS
jgi:hypothetical protein